MDCEGMGRMIPIKFAERDEKPERVIRIRQANLALSKFLLLRDMKCEELSPPNNHRERDCQESREVEKVETNEKKYPYEHIRVEQWLRKFLIN